MKSRAPVLRWSALRDKKTPLKEVTESFLVHRHDLSPATQDNYRLQFRLYDGWVAAQLGRPTRVEDVEPGTVNAYLEHRRSTISECARVRLGHRWEAAHPARSAALQCRLNWSLVLEDRDLQLFRLNPLHGRAVAVPLGTNARRRQVVTSFTHRGRCFV